MRMQALIESEVVQEDLIEKGSAQVLKYSWVDSASIILKEFENCA